MMSYGDQIYTTQPEPGGFRMHSSVLPIDYDPNINRPQNVDGLSYLVALDQVLIHQVVELLEALIGFEGANKYVIKNSMGQQCFYAVEDVDCCTRNCLGTMRPFLMKILNNSQREIIHFYRPYRCISCCFPCCLQRLEVMSPPGNLIGYVIQEWSLFVPKFRIENSHRECVLRIEGPFCISKCCSDINFQILTKDGSTSIGKIAKQWSGLVREMFTDADHFGITFPIDLDVNVKATLIGACFLIDLMYFEANSGAGDCGSIFDCASAFI